MYLVITTKKLLSTRTSSIINSRKHLLINNNKRLFSSSTTAEKNNNKDIDKWIPRADPGTGKLFYYHMDTFESRDSLDEKPKEYKKPEYSTSWKDEKFPNWVQFLELNSKRPYYWNLDDGKTSWTPPGQPDLDVFKIELEQMQKSLIKVPDNAPSAPILKRLGAVGLDIFFSTCFGSVFGLLVYFDLGRLNDAAIPAAAFSGWFVFFARDALFEKGTRSLGKRIMKLEIVRNNGVLPNRFYTCLRSIYLPLYGGSIFLMPYILLLPVLDFGLMLFTPKSYRLGDILGNTRVIQELPDRKIRMEEKINKEAADDLKE